MLRARGIPTRSTLRRSMAAIRAFAARVHARVGKGSATLSGPRGRKGSFAAISTKFGFALRIASKPDLIPRMSLTSSTVPFSHVAIIRRCSSAAFATFETNLAETALTRGGAAAAAPEPTCSAADVGTPILISINVRRQLFLQKLQRVDSLRVVRYVIF